MCVVYVIFFLFVMMLVISVVWCLRSSDLRLVIFVSIVLMCVVVLLSLLVILICLLRGGSGIGVVFRIVFVMCWVFGCILVVIVVK